MSLHGNAVIPCNEKSASVYEANAGDVCKYEDHEGFVPLQEGDIADFYRQFSRARREPAFMGMFKPVQYQSATQFAEYFTVGSRPLWVLGRPESPTAYFCLHAMLSQHDLANLDFAYFSAYPNPGSEAAGAFWKYLLSCMRVRGLTRVQSFVIDTCTEKIQLLESLGFRNEGLLREHYYHNGRMHDVVVLAWMAEERLV